MQVKKYGCRRFLLLIKSSGINSTNFFKRFTARAILSPVQPISLASDLLEGMLLSALANQRARAMKVSFSTLGRSRSKMAELA